MPILQDIYTSMHEELQSQVEHGGVNRSSASDALGLWFEANSTSKNTTSLPRCHEAPSEPGTSLTSDRGWVNKK